LNIDRPVPRKAAGYNHGESTVSARNMERW